jgi:hypothetical protein
MTPAKYPKVASGGAVQCEFCDRWFSSPSGNFYGKHLGASHGLEAMERYPTEYGYTLSVAIRRLPPPSTPRPGPNLPPGYVPLFPVEPPNNPDLEPPLFVEARAEREDALVRFYRSAIQYNQFRVMALRAFNRREAAEALFRGFDTALRRTYSK